MLLLWLLRLQWELLLLLLLLVGRGRVGRGVVGWGQVEGATAGPANSTNPQARVMTDTGGAHPTLTALGGADSDRHANLRGASSVIMTKAGNEEGGEAAAGRVATPITTRGHV